MTYWLWVTEELRMRQTQTDTDRVTPHGHSLTSLTEWREWLSHLTDSWLTSQSECESSDPSVSLPVIDSVSSHSVSHCQWVWVTLSSDSESVSDSDVSTDSWQWLSQSHSQWRESDSSLSVTHLLNVSDWNTASGGSTHRICRTNRLIQLGAWIVTHFFNVDQVVPARNKSKSGEWMDKSRTGAFLRRDGSEADARFFYHNPLILFYYTYLL